MERIEIEVANLGEPRRRERVEFLLDSGVFRSVVPAAVLEGLGIRPLSEETFFLPNGEQIIRKKGVAQFHYNARTGGGDVPFGEYGDIAVVGSLTLASLGLFLDPLRRELRDLPMMLAQTSSRES